MIINKEPLEHFTVKRIFAAQAHDPERKINAFLVHNNFVKDNSDDRIIFDPHKRYALPNEDIDIDDFVNTHGDRPTFLDDSYFISLLQELRSAPTIAYKRSDGVYVANDVVYIEAGGIEFDSFEEYLDFSSQVFNGSIEDDGFDWYDGTDDSIITAFKELLDYDYTFHQKSDICYLGRCVDVDEEYIVFRDGTDPHEPLEKVLERALPDVIRETRKTIESLSTENNRM